MRRTIHSFRFVSLVLALILTIGVAGLASAQNVPPQQPAAPYQATTAATVEPTVIDPDVPVPLTIGQSTTTPIDEENVEYRLFTFSGKANQVVNIAFQRTSGNFAMDVTVLSQSDVEMARVYGDWLDAFTLIVRLPQDGTYRVRLNHSKPGVGDFAPGTVSVSLSEAKASGAPATATASK